MKVMNALNLNTECDSIELRMSVMRMKRRRAPVMRFGNILVENGRRVGSNSNAMLLDVNLNGYLTDGAVDIRA